MARPRNLAFVVGIVAVLGGGAAIFIATRGGAEPSSVTATSMRETGPTKSTDRSAAAAVAEPVAIKQRAPDRPSLPSDPARPEGSAAQTPSEEFSVEARDAAWATPMEGEIKDRLAKAPVNVVADCRQSHCQIQLDGESEAISQTISIMESHKGMIGFADNIYLTAPEVHADGTMTLKAIASFAR